MTGLIIFCRTVGISSSVEFANKISSQDLMAAGGSRERRQLENFRFQLTVGMGRDIRPSLVAFAVEKGLIIN